MLPHVLVSILSCLSLTLAYPEMDPSYPGPTPRARDIHDPMDRRILGLGGVVAGLGQTVTNLIGTLTGGLATGVSPSDKRPDVSHPFQAPGATDQRGPCPGLNALANHGYISRTGIVTATEVMAGVLEGFNMGEDLSALLVFVAIAFGGNLATSTFSLGGEDSRTYSDEGIGAKSFGRQYGLDGHSRCEGDISALRRDYYLNNGDNHNAYPDRFKRFIELAKENGNEFGLIAANKLYAENAQLSVAQNPKLFFNGYNIIVILGEYPFIPNFFSNGTYGRGGIANYGSMSSLMGQSINKDGTICYVPERFPDNWYRRSSPYGIVDLVAGLAGTYLTGPSLTLPNGLGVLQNGAQAPQIGCAIYQAITSEIPASLLGETNDYISAAITYLQNNLLPTIPSLYGCSPSQPTLQENGTGGAQYTTGTTGVSQQYNICA